MPNKILCHLLYKFSTRNINPSITLMHIQLINLLFTIMKSCKLEKGGKKKYIYNVDPIFERVQVLFVNFGTLLLLLSIFFSPSRNKENSITQN